MKSTILSPRAKVATEYPPPNFQSRRSIMNSVFPVACVTSPSGELTKQPTFSPSPLSIRPLSTRGSAGKVRTGPGSVGSAFLMDYSWYEGPNPPLGFAFYNARWQQKGLPEPFYAFLPGPDSTKRRQRFLTKVYAMLMLEMLLMATAIAIFDWFTT